MVWRLQNCGSLRWNSYPISCLKMWFPKVGIVLIQHSPPGQWSKLKKEVKNTGHFKILRISVIFCMQTNYAWANNIAQVFCNDPLTLSHWPIQWLWVVLQWSSQGLNWSDSSLVAICIYQIFWLVLLQYLMVDIWVGQYLNVSITLMFCSTFASSYHQMFLISKSSRSSFARICSTYFHHTRVCTHHIGIRMHLFNRTALWHSLSRCSYKVQAAWSTRLTTLTTASLARSSAGKARWPDLR